MMMGSGQLFHGLLCLILLSQAYNKYGECAPTTTTTSDSAQVASLKSEHYGEGLSISTNKETLKPIPNNATSSQEDQSSEENQQPGSPTPGSQLGGSGVQTVSLDSVKKSFRSQPDFDYHDAEVRSMSRVGIPDKLKNGSDEETPKTQAEPVGDNVEVVQVTLVQTFTFLIDVPSNESAEANETSSETQEGHSRSSNALDEDLNENVASINQNRNRREVEVVVLPNPDSPAVVILNEVSSGTTDVTLIEADGSGNSGSNESSISSESTEQPHALSRRSYELTLTGTPPGTANTTALSHGPQPAHLHQSSSEEAESEGPYIPFITHLPRPQPKTASVPASNVSTPLAANHENSQSPTGLSAGTQSQRRRRNVFFPNLHHGNGSHAASSGVESDEESGFEASNSSSAESQEGTGPRNKTVLILLLYVHRNNSSLVSSEEGPTSTTKYLSGDTYVDDSTPVISSRKRRQAPASTNSTNSTSNSTTNTANTTEAAGSTVPAASGTAATPLANSSAGVSGTASSINSSAIVTGATSPDNSSGTLAGTLTNSSAIVAAGTTPPPSANSSAIVGGTASLGNTNTTAGTGTTASSNATLVAPTVNVNATQPSPTASSTATSAVPSASPASTTANTSGTISAQNASTSNASSTQIQASPVPSTISVKVGNLESSGVTITSPGSGSSSVVLGSSSSQDTAGGDDKAEISYAVSDKPTHNFFSVKESLDGNVTKGSYRVLLPDGRTEVVDFTADDSGYHPNVTYVGPAAVSSAAP